MAKHSQPPHKLWKARAKNHRSALNHSQTLLQLLENDIRFSTNHPYFNLPDHRTIRRLAYLDLITDLLDMIKADLAQDQDKG